MPYPIPKNYTPLFAIRDIESAIKMIKDRFERSLSDAVGLQRVTAPIFVRRGLGLNDDLNGVEKPVSFHVQAVNFDIEIVQSLAKWKRHALKRYGFKEGEGLYTDMNAIRPDETIDYIHSFYVDQWDWEKIISPKDRHRETLETTVRAIYSAMLDTERYLAERYPVVQPILPKEITFITSEELLERYPNLSPKQREAEITKKHGAVFIIGIGGKLSNGESHDGRAPDYDDWSTPRPDGGFGLNGDILVWHPGIELAFELSSMGIRVDAVTLQRQLELRNCPERAELPFHRSLLAGELPQSMGGGIGQSRLCMFMLRCVHIGEVACGVWTDDMIEAYAEKKVFLL